MRIAQLNIRLIALLATAPPFWALLEPVPAFAQNILVLVNDEPITTYDVEQRMRWNALTSNFGDRMKALLTGDSINQKFKEKMIAAQPHSQAEAQAVAERIKKELIEDAKRRVMAEGGGTTRKAVIDVLIEDKLKLQASKRLDVKVSDREVLESIEQRIASETAEKKAKVEQFYQQFETNGVSRRNVRSSSACSLPGGTS